MLTWWGIMLDVVDTPYRGGVLCLRGGVLCSASVWRIHHIKHNWLTVEQLIKFDRSVMTYKIINRQCSESLWDKYHQRTQLSNHITRNCRDLQIPRNNLEYVKKGFHYSALKAWNDIPIGIRELPTLRRFKKQLKCYFKS